MLEIKHINKTYDENLILDDINLLIDKPRIVALVAPNGSGKTTLLNIICNLEKADSGTVEVFGLSNTDIEVFNQLSFMQDNSVLFEELTGRDHLSLIKDVYSVENCYVDEILEKFDMTKNINKKVKNYSLGMKQKLLFILALLPRPRIILLDEPLNGLDPVSVVTVREILINLKNEGTTVILSSHNLDEISKITKDIYFLIGKKLQHYNDIIGKESINRFEIITESSELLIEKISDKIITYKTLSPYECYIETRLTDSEIKNTVSDVIIFKCKKIEKSLEQVYFDLYEEQQ